MDLPINSAKPLTMHIDLNSCFAIIEQQANPLYRNKPLAVAAYDTPGGMILASSYEAKTLGIKLGYSVSDARRVCPGIIVLTPDPEKYFEAHRRFKKVLLKYTDEVVPKSIDEFVVDFKGSLAVQNNQSLVEVGHQIKRDIKESLGEYVTVNVGIGPNRFLAKLAAGLNKPDGLDVIDSNNLTKIYSNLELMDLPGINTRYRTRLRMNQIYTPMQFIDASVEKLKKQVFKGIVGHYWYLRLRGYEIDNVNFGRKSFGHQYALSKKTKDKKQLDKLIMKLCEKTGRRLRHGNYQAGGIHLWLRFEDGHYWSKGQKTNSRMYSTGDIYLQTQKLLNQLEPILQRVSVMGVTVFDLTGTEPKQLGIFDNTRLDNKTLAYASDIINDRYGEFTLVPATMANMQNVILKRVAFGNVSEIHD